MMYLIHSGGDGYWRKEKNMSDLIKLEELHTTKLIKWYAAQLIEPYPSVSMFEETKTEMRNRGIKIKDEILTVKCEHEGKEYEVVVSNERGMIDFKQS